MQLERCWNTLGIFGILSECLDCVSIPDRITPEVWLELKYLEYYTKLYECSQNTPGMAAEYISNVLEFKQNAAGIPRMYFEFSWNVTGMFKAYRV